MALKFVKGETFGSYDEEEKKIAAYTKRNFVHFVKINYWSNYNSISNN